MASSRISNNAPNWRKWCRLCAKDDPQNNITIINWKNVPNVDITTPIIKTISKHFSIDFRNDDTNAYICVECYKLVISLISFTERVDRVQAMFNVLQTTDAEITIHPDVVRLQFNILDEDRYHIIKDANSKVCVKVPLKKVESVSEQTVEEFKSKKIQISDEDETENDLVNDRRLEANSIETKTRSVCDESICNAPYHCVELKDIKPESNLVGENKTLQTESIQIKIESIEVDETVEQMEFLSNVAPPPVEENFTSHDTESQKMQKRTIVSNQKHGSIKRKQKSNHKPVNFNEEHTGKQFLCPHCNRNYTCAFTLRRHISNIHFKERPYACNACKRTFQQRSQINKHLCYPPSDKTVSISCPRCKKVFNTVAAATKHLRYEHDNEFVCEKCGCNFDEAKFFALHTC